MTDIGIKNGSVITKNGRLAQGCGCCQGQGEETACVCTPTSVNVTISAENFIRHLLLRDQFGSELKVSLAYEAAPSSGLFALSKLSSGPGSGSDISVPLRWESQPVNLPSNALYYNRIRAGLAFGPPSEFFVLVPMLRLRWVANPSQPDYRFFSLSELRDKLANFDIFPSTAFAMMYLRFLCTSQNGSTRAYATDLINGESFGGAVAWTPRGSSMPCTLADFSYVKGVGVNAFGIDGASVLLAGPEPLLAPFFGFNIIEDNRSGSPIVTLESVEIECEGDPLP